MFRERFGIDAIRYQRLANISTMGWSIKALTAALCDTFAFLGYTKRWYMFVSCVLGGVFAIIFASLPPKPSSADTGAAFVFLTSFGKANVDILSEGHYSNVSLLLLVGHILLPLLVVPLTLLLPSARICDDLDVDGKAIKKELKGKDTAAAPTTAMIGAEPDYCEEQNSSLLFDGEEGARAKRRET